MVSTETDAAPSEVVGVPSAGDATANAKEDEEKSLIRVAAALPLRNVLDLTGASIAPTAETSSHTEHGNNDAGEILLPQVSHVRHFAMGKDVQLVFITPDRNRTRVWLLVICSSWLSCVLRASREHFSETTFPFARSKQRLFLRYGRLAREDRILFARL
jgi:hypothetical protein